MSKARMVTRTIHTTKVNCLVANPQTKQIDETTLSLAGTFADEKSLAKALKKLETEALKVLTVYSTEVVDTLYGMTEQMFMELAKPLKGAEAEAEATEAVEAE